MCKDSLDAIEEQWKSLRVGLVEVKHGVRSFNVLTVLMFFLFPFFFVIFLFDTLSTGRVKEIRSQISMFFRYKNVFIKFLLM